MGQGMGESDGTDGASAEQSPLADELDEHGRPTRQNHHASQHLKQPDGDEGQLVGFHVGSEGIDRIQHRSPEQEQNTKRTEGVPCCVPNAGGSHATGSPDGEFP